MAYGSTKCGLRQLQSSLLKESAQNVKSWSAYSLSRPAWPRQTLLLSSSTIQNKQMFNIICELPETVARTLVPWPVGAGCEGKWKAINYLLWSLHGYREVVGLMSREKHYMQQIEADRLRN